MAFISQQSRSQGNLPRVGEGGGLEHSHNREVWPVAKGSIDWSTGKV